jgi:hypothetical protein
MIENDKPRLRRANDRDTLYIVDILAQKMANFIDRFDKFVALETDSHDKITETLLRHEELVIKTVTSWKWVTTLSGIIGALMMSLGIFFYQELTDLKAAVLVHHTQDSLRVQRQESINDELDAKLKNLERH